MLELVWKQKNKQDMVFGEVFHYVKKIDILIVKLR